MLFNIRRGGSRLSMREFRAWTVTSDRVLRRFMRNRPTKACLESGSEFVGDAWESGEDGRDSGGG